MTTTDPYTAPTDPVLPPGANALDSLTVGELGTIGKALKLDPYVAVGKDETGVRWPALAHAAWVWAKRTDPRAKLSPFLELTADEVRHLLRMDEDEDQDQADADPAADPTDSPPA